MSGCSRVVRRCVASAEVAGSTPASRSKRIMMCFRLVWQRWQCTLIRNEDNAGSNPAASSRK